MSCEHCLAATSGLHARFANSCRGCRARRVGRSNEFWNAKTVKPGEHDFDRMRDRYRGLLVQADVSHQEVKDAAAADFEQRVAA